MYIINLISIFALDTTTIEPMSTKTMTRKIAEYFKTQPVTKAWLFGSYARGEETKDSDVDLLVALDYSQPVGLAFFGMYEDLRALLGRNVDLVSERTLAPYARESVEKDKKLIYERATVVTENIPTLRKQVANYLSSTDWGQWEQQPFDA